MSADYPVLQQLHHFCQQHFQYAEDICIHSASDYWMSPSEIRDQLSQIGRVIGDCDDFASLAVMLARQQAIAARFVLCMTENDEMHLVAEVDGWILDNRQPDVMRRDDLPYSWLAISGYQPGQPWHAIEGGIYA